MTGANIFHRFAGRRVTLLLLAAGLLCSPANAAGRDSGPQAEVRILIVTGGHDFEEAGFFEIFRQMKGVAFEHAVFGQGAEEKLTPEGAQSYDAIVFYDMHQEKDPQSKGMQRLLAQGKGMLFLHHSLWSYDGTWPEYRRIVGGRASSKEKVVPGSSATSTFKDDQHFRIHVADNSNPITKGVQDFDIVDETYNHFWMDPRMHALLTTDNDTTERVIAWTHRYKKARVAYIMLGHGPSAYENTNYQTLLRQAVLWVAKK